MSNTRIVYTSTTNGEGDTHPNRLSLRQKEDIATICEEIGEKATREILTCLPASFAPFRVTLTFEEDTP